MKARDKMKRRSYKKHGRQLLRDKKNILIFYKSIEKCQSDFYFEAGWSPDFTFLIYRELFVTL